jgi:DNA-binding winged helix-turn-helix (wHTH) protein/Tol biopolymer transport system component
MASPVRSTSVIRFGTFELDTAHGTLRKAGISVKLHPQPFRVLSLLAECPGQIVTRERIQHCLWGDNTFVDFEGGINFCVKQIRAALGDDPEKPRYIETLHRRGYRFIAPVSNDHIVQPHATSIPSSVAMMPPPACNESKLAALIAPVVPSIVSSEPTHMYSVPPWKRKSTLALICLFALVFILSSILWITKGQPRHALNLSELKQVQLTANSFENRVIGGGISPDGKFLAYSDVKRMYLKLIATGETRVVPQPKEFTDQNNLVWQSIFWFPDSTRFIANAHHPDPRIDHWTSQESSVWIASVLGEAPHRLRDHAIAYSVSPDGSAISFGTNNGRLGDREIWLMSPNGEKAHKLFDADEESSIGALQWSNDGKRVMYTKTGESGVTLLSRDLHGGSLITILEPSEMKSVTDFFWLADGRLLYSVAEPEFNGPCDLWEMTFDGSTGKPLAKSKRLASWFGFRMSGISQTSDGKKLAFLKSVGRATSFLADSAEGGKHILNPRHFPLNEVSEGVVDWTPDSKTVLLMSYRPGYPGIYKQALDQDVADPLVTEGYGRNPRVTPDGKSVVYLGIGVAGAPPIKAPEPVMRVSINGGPSQQLFMARTYSLITCAMVPSGPCLIGEPVQDGKQLAVTVLDPANGRGPEIFRFSLVAGDDNWFLDISPDGTRIAATRTLTSPIYILSLRGKLLQEIQVKGWSNLESFFWAADGKGLFVTSAIPNAKDVLYVDLRGNAYKLWENTGGSAETLAHPSPDGRHVALNGWTTTSNIWLMENF